MYSDEFAQVLILVFCREKNQFLLPSETKEVVFFSLISRNKLSKVFCQWCSFHPLVLGNIIHPAKTTLCLLA